MQLQLLLKGLHLDPAPWDRLFQQSHAAKDLPHLSRGRQEREKAVHHSLESDKLGVRQIDPLLNGVYHQFSRQ